MFTRCKKILNISIVKYPRQMKSLFKTTSKLSQILGFLNNTFKPNIVQKFSGIKVYKAVALPIVLSESEILTLRKIYKE